MSKKIMFNDKFDLTQAVLDGRKTMTRRIVSEKLLDRWTDYDEKDFFLIMHHINLVKSLPLRKVIWMLTDFIERGKMRLT